MPLRCGGGHFHNGENNIKKIQIYKKQEYCQFCYMVEKLDLLSLMEECRLKKYLTTGF
jgi:hypothetical protein